MSKKLVSIIFLGICLLLVGCGKEVVDSKYTGKWKLESSGIGNERWIKLQGNGCSG